MALRRDIDLLEVEMITERLIIRPTSVADLLRIFEEFNESVARFMTPAPARSSVETAAFIAGSIEGMTNGTNLQLTILLKEERTTFAGVLGLHRLESRTPEIGVWLAESSQGKGLGLEAVAELCAWASDEIEDEYDKITTDGRTLNLVEYRIYPETL